MVLSNIAIREAIEKRFIIIEPKPDLENADTTAVDLRLGNLLSIPKKDLKHIQLSPYNPYDKTKGSIASTLSVLCEPKELKPGEPFILEPGIFILGQTLEYIYLPILEGEEGSYAARVEGKSSLARCGLIVHFTAPTIHAGFEGRITLEIINLGCFPIALYCQMPICQIIFEPVLGPIQKNISQFHGQITPEGLK